MTYLPLNMKNQNHVKNPNLSLLVIVIILPPPKECPPNFCHWRCHCIQPSVFVCVCVWVLFVCLFVCFSNWLVIIVLFRYCCSSGCCPGGSVGLSSRVLAYVLDLLNDGYSLQVTLFNLFNFDNNVIANNITALYITTQNVSITCYTPLCGLYLSCSKPLTLLEN